MSYENPVKAGTIIKYIAASVVGLFILIVGACSMTTVDTGHRGVKVRFGEVMGEGLTEGLYFINPFTTDIVEMDVRVLKWDGETQAYTKDVQQAVIHFTLTYGLHQAKAADTYRTVGVDWAAKLVGQVVNEEIKREFGQHEAVELVAQRDRASRAIESALISKLGERNIHVSGFQLTNIDYTKEFEHAVEAKVIAQQAAIEEQNRTVQKQELATQQIVQAKGNAEATILNAKAEAESIRIRANALEANAKLVEWEAVQKWNGILPQYMLGNSTPFINIK